MKCAGRSRQRLKATVSTLARLGAQALVPVRQDDK